MGCEQGSVCRVRLSQAGFTLLEILVVITIMAISIAMVAPSFISVSDADAGAEMRRLHQVLRLAAEEAQLTGMPLRWVARKDSYYFEMLNSEQAWDVLTDSPFEKYLLPTGVEISAINLSGAPALQRSVEEGDNEKREEVLARLVLWPDGMFDAADVTISSDAADNPANSLQLQIRSGPGGIRIIEESPA